MTWIVDLIPGGALTVIVAGVMAVLAAIGVVSRKATLAERNRNAAKEAEARAKNLDQIKKSTDAANRIQPDVGELSDPRNRDNRR